MNTTRETVDSFAEVTGSRGYLSQSELVLTFGLGKAAKHGTANRAKGQDRRIDFGEHVISQGR